jgi:hypothetical protein
MCAGMLVMVRLYVNCVVIDGANVGVNLTRCNRGVKKVKIKSSYRIARKLGDTLAAFQGARCMIFGKAMS